MGSRFLLAERLADDEAKITGSVIGSGSEQSNCTHQDTQNLRYKQFSSLYCPGHYYHYFIIHITKFGSSLARGNIPP